MDRGHGARDGVDARRARRKIASGILQAGWPIGVMLAAGVAMFVIGEHSWRPMFLVGSVPALLDDPAVVHVPEHAARAAHGRVAKRSAIKDLARRRACRDARPRLAS